MKAALLAWYNRNISAGWYGTLTVLGSWATGALVWAPDFLNWALDHSDFFFGRALPTMDPETKAVVLSLFLAVGVPALRAKLQAWVQKKTITQQAETGKVVPLPASGVSPVGKLSSDE